MHAHDAVDPAGRGVQRGSGHDGLGELARMDFKPPCAFGCSRRMLPADFIILTVSSVSLPIFSASAPWLRSCSAMSRTRSITRSVIVWSYRRGLY